MGAKEREEGERKRLHSLLNSHGMLEPCSDLSGRESCEVSLM